MTSYFPGYKRYNKPPLNHNWAHIHEYPGLSDNRECKDCGFVCWAPFELEGKWISAMDHFKEIVSCKEYQEICNMEDALE